MRAGYDHLGAQESRYRKVFVMIYFVTSNKGKFLEANAIFGDLIQKDIGYTEIQADTLEEVAAFGMREVAERLQGPVMLEDAGLFVEALSGFPGVYSAYVQKTIGNRGILRLMEGVENRRAYFRLCGRLHRARDGAPNVSGRGSWQNRHRGARHEGIWL